MRINSLFTGVDLKFNLTISAGVSIVTLVALAIITAPTFWSLTLVIGTVLAIIPLATAFKHRRIVRDNDRAQEILPHKDKIAGYDALFDEEHQLYTKYWKIRQRLSDPGYNVNQIFKEIDDLISSSPV